MYFVGYFGHTLVILCGILWSSFGGYFDCTLWNTLVIHVLCGILWSYFVEYFGHTFGYTLVILCGIRWSHFVEHFGNDVKLSQMSEKCYLRSFVEIDVTKIVTFRDCLYLFNGK